MKKILLFLSLAMLMAQANFLSNIKSIKSDFTQNITNEENKTISYSGEFYAKDDGKALWVYKKPIKKSLYFLNGKVVIIEPDLEQAIFSKVDNFPKVLNILKTAKKVKDGYIAKCCDKDYKIYVKDDKIDKITYTDKVGNRVVIKFFNQDTNLILSDKIFQYNIPKDYDILKN